jgi:trans-aconitate 2-methyltransferase
VTDAWSPDKYREFASERRQPFEDLLALIRGPVARAVDLGCGPGELTAEAAHRLGCASMIGIDNSAAMLAKSGEHAGTGVSFADGDIAGWTSNHDIDLVLASASLQWVPDHRGVLERWAAALRPRGQIAVQVPANAYMPSHTTADAVAHSEPFLSAFGLEGPPSDPVADNVLEPEAYATILHDLGFVEQHVRLQIYPHLLPSSRSVVDWVRGTTLTRFQRLLEPPVFDAFVRAYEERLIATIGEHAPYFFPFRRILMWGRLAG